MQMQCSDTMTTKPIVNFVPHGTKHGNEIVWNESTILLVKFPDDKKYVLSTNPQTARMENLILPIATSAASPNINTIVKKLNIGPHMQQSAVASPPLNLQLAQIAAQVVVHPDVLVWRPTHASRTDWVIFRIFHIPAAPEVQHF